MLDEAVIEKVVKDMIVDQEFEKLDNLRQDLIEENLQFTKTRKNTKAIGRAALAVTLVGALGSFFIDGQTPELLAVGGASAYVGKLLGDGVLNIATICSAVKLSNENKKIKNSFKDRYMVEKNESILVNKIENANIDRKQLLRDYAEELPYTDRDYVDDFLHSLQSGQFVNIFDDYYLPIKEEMDREEISKAWCEFIEEHYGIESDKFDDMSETDQENQQDNSSDSYIDEDTDDIDLL